MKELIERLEKATGPDTMLDCNIREAVEGWKNVGGGYREWPDGRREQYDYGHAQPFTSSIDAAMTLTPQGYRPLVRTHDGKPLTGSTEGKKAKAFASMSSFASDGPIYDAWAQTMPLAICLAALRTRAASR